MSFVIQLFGFADNEKARTLFAQAAEEGGATARLRMRQQSPFVRLVRDAEVVVQVLIEHGGRFSR